jgi:hypothetical protein
VRTGQDAFSATIRSALGRTKGPTSPAVRPLGPSGQPTVPASSGTTSTLTPASGAKASRPQLDVLLKVLRAGDTLKITRLDRLGRSVLHLVTLGAELRERGGGLHVLEQGIDTSWFGRRSSTRRRDLVLTVAGPGLSFPPGEAA